MEALADADVSRALAEALALLPEALAEAEADARDLLADESSPASEEETDLRDEDTEAAIDPITGVVAAALALLGFEAFPHWALCCVWAAARSTLPGQLL